MSVEVLVFQTWMKGFWLTVKTDQERGPRKTSSIISPVPEDNGHVSPSTVAFSLTHHQRRTQGFLLRRPSWMCWGHYFPSALLFYTCPLHKYSWLARSLNLIVPRQIPISFHHSKQVLKDNEDNFLLEFFFFYINSTWVGLIDQILSTVYAQTH